MRLLSIIVIRWLSTLCRFLTKHLFVALFQNVCVCAGILLRDQRFCDCAEAYKAGHNISGVYYIYISNMTEPTQVNK